MVHDLLLAITGTRGDAGALTAAISLATQMGAHLTLVQTIHLPVTMTEPWGMMGGSIVGELHDELRAKGEREAAKLRQRLEREGISFEVRSIETHLQDPSRPVALHARYADIAMVASPLQDNGDGVVAQDYFVSLLFESGRPVLVLPAQQTMLPLPQHVVLAWQPTREATRALHDAMPLLRTAGTIDVVMVDPIPGESRHGEDPGVDIAAHLARHGFNANVVALPGNGQTTAAVLLRRAAESGAQLVVAGGYGHSRLREWMLGGTTRELLNASRIPMLFAH